MWEERRKIWVGNSSRLQQNNFCKKADMKQNPAYLQKTVDAPSVVAISFVAALYLDSPPTDILYLLHFNNLTVG